MLCSLISVFAQEARVLDNLSLPSEVLGGERKFAVYLPPDYETSSRTYPVLYLLHGHTDDHTGWIQFGEVHHIATQAIANGEATPMIIVMPDADTGTPGYVNALSGNWNYEDFFFNELIPHVEDRFRIKKISDFVPSQAFLWVEGVALFMRSEGLIYSPQRHPSVPL